MQLSLPWDATPPPSDSIPVSLVRHPRARRYVLRVRPDGSVRVTIPRRGSRRGALAFVDANQNWIARTRERLGRRREPAAWGDGTIIWLRGARVPLSLGRDEVSWWVEVGGDRISVAAGSSCVRLAVQAHLRRLADDELPPRLGELAVAHGIDITRILVRNQRTRWGSCSPAGTVSLNWRLVQVPAPVRDYVMIHELMHRRQADHSRAFWRLVAGACPEYEAARRWLRAHGPGLA
jgi:hypothetical protein